MYGSLLQSGWSALTWASKQGHLQIVQLLIEKAVDLDHRDEVSLMTMLLLD